MAMRQTPLTCSGHTRPVVDLAFSGITPYGYFLISACKGELSPRRPRLPGAEGWVGRSCGLKRLRCCNSGFCSPLARLYVFLLTTVFSAPQHCAFLHTHNYSVLPKDLREGEIRPGREECLLGLLIRLIVSAFVV